jgi:hypothetical protein
MGHDRSTFGVWDLAGSMLAVPMRYSRQRLSGAFADADDAVAEDFSWLTYPPFRQEVR